MYEFSKAGQGKKGKNYKCAFYVNFFNELTMYETSYHCPINNICRSGTVLLFNTPYRNVFDRHTVFF